MLRVKAAKAMYKKGEFLGYFLFRYSLIFCGVLMLNIGLLYSQADTVFIDEEEQVEETGFSFFVPNAFTPNGDGNNDEFYGTGDEILTQDIMIYDRRGTLIFKSSESSMDYLEKWNGRVNNAWDKAPEGVYLYVIQVLDTYGKRHRFLGHVSLLR